jgi:hypothetical protein
LDKTDDLLVTRFGSKDDPRELRKQLEDEKARSARELEVRDEALAAAVKKADEQVQEAEKKALSEIEAAKQEVENRAEEFREEGRQKIVIAANERINAANEAVREQTGYTRDAEQQAQAAKQELLEARGLQQELSNRIEELGRENQRLWGLAEKAQQGPSPASMSLSEEPTSDSARPGVVIRVSGVTAGDSPVPFKADTPEEPAQPLSFVPGTLLMVGNEPSQRAESQHIKIGDASLLAAGYADTGTEKQAKEEAFCLFRIEAGKKTVAFLAGVFDGSSPSEAAEGLDSLKEDADFADALRRLGNSASDPDAERKIQQSLETVAPQGAQASWSLVLILERRFLAVSSGPEPGIFSVSKGRSQAKPAGGGEQASYLAVLHQARTQTLAPLQLQGGRSGWGRLAEGGRLLLAGGHVRSQIQDQTFKTSVQEIFEKGTLGDMKSLEGAALNLVEAANRRGAGWLKASAKKLTGFGKLNDKPATTMVLIEAVHLPAAGPRQNRGAGPSQGQQAGLEEKGPADQQEPDMSLRRFLKRTAAVGAAAYTAPWWVRLLGWLSAEEAPAIEEKAVSFLLGQQKMESPRTGLLASYAGIPDTDPMARYIKGRAYTYDQALAAIALTAAGRKTEASRILTALMIAEIPTGLLGFAYALEDGKEDHPTTYAGSLAWAGEACLFYEKRTKDAQFRPMAERIAKRLLSWTDPATGLIRGGQRSPENPIRWISTEHNLDAYFFLRDLGKLEEANRIKEGILKHLWVEDRGLFKRGLNDSVPVLDTQVWGGLFLLAIGQKEKAQSVRSTITEGFLKKGSLSDGISVEGYAPYVMDELVWAEGSLGVALLDRRLGDTKPADEIVQQILKLRDPSGGFRASSRRVRSRIPDDDSTHTTFPHVAATAWFLIQALNPEDFWSPSGLEEKGSAERPEPALEKFREHLLDHQV